MTTVAWPSLSCSPTRQQWSLTASTQVATSPLNGATQTQAMPGMLWATTIEYALRGAEANKFEAFLLALQGRSGRVAVGNFGAPRPRGSASGAPLVNGFPYLAGAITIGTDGWTPGATMMAGDYFGLNGRLYMQTQDASANFAGQMTLTFVPPLLKTPADNDVVTLRLPTTQMMLLDDRQGWAYVAGGLRTYTVDLIEAI